MTIRNFQQAVCDRCSVTRQVPAEGSDDRYRQLHGWVWVEIRNVAGTGLTGGDIRPVSALCENCRRELAAWFAPMTLRATNNPNGATDDRG